MIYSPPDKTQAFAPKFGRNSVFSDNNKINKIDIFLRKPILRAFLFLENKEKILK